MQKLTKRQIKLAAKAYVCSVIRLGSGLNEGDNENENSVIQQSHLDAEKIFWRTFPHEKRIPTTLSECVELAKRSNLA